jgi:hypothetical protein
VTTKFTPLPKWKVSKWTAELMKKKIKEYFEGIKEQQPVVTHTILYYSGAAKENGDWHCQADDS